MKPIIQIDNLYKKYKNADFFSVQDLSLQIDQGEIYGLLGPNGAGKTTLISIVCGLIMPTTGTFLIDGLSFDKNSQQIKKIIGVVPQEYALYPTLTAFENLVYFGSMYGLKGTELKSKINTLLERLGLLSFAHKRIETFSGGMKRRINLIAGLLHQPKILFLDEPTVGVDVQSRNVIIEFLKELNASGTTIIYTSHHLVEAADLCSQIAIIDQGKIFISGTPTDLVNQTAGAKDLEDVFLALTGNQLRDVV